MINVDSDADYTDFYLGSVAPAGYIWVFPKGEKQANVGIGVTLTALKDRFDVRKYLDNWIKNHPGYAKGKTIQYITGGVSVSKVRDKFTLPGLLLVGDAARLIDPITGGGIANSYISGKFAASVAKEAIESENYSQEMMLKYEKMVKDKFQRKHLRNWIAKEKLGQLSDESLDKLIDIISDAPINDISVEELLRTVQQKYPEMVAELEDLI